MNKNLAKQQIQKLIEKYQEVEVSGKINSFTEEDTKNVFIKPLFEALDWDFADRDEVSAEENIISSGRVDYGFYINNRPKFYLEAKKLKADLNIEDFARQAIRYSFNKGVTWAILTDFESVKVFNAQSPSQYLGDKLYFEIRWQEYLDRFDKLWELSKESFLEDLIDREAEKVGKKLQRVPITETLAQDLEKSREILANDLSKWNDNLSKDILDEGVQKILDRLIFLRVVEDRGIESSILKSMVNQWESGGKKTTLYKSMVSKFRELDEYYNSSLFSKDVSEDWDEYSDAVKRVIKILYGKEGYYDYDFSVMPADVLGNVYENYLGYKLSQSKKGLTVDKAAGKRKEQGIYYTPAFIVDYIVRNALNPVLDKCRDVDDLKKIKVLDPACGSGSFLIKALEVILEKYKAFNYSDNQNLRVQIVLENLYGVDLDEQAVEIARLNLLINSLEERAKLPSLENNIKNGNSLISGTDEELKKYFGKNFRDKRSFNWKEEFPEVFKQGGFDVIIGNPPYGADLSEEDKKYFGAHTELSDYQLDTYILFIEKVLKELLRKDGLLGFIIPNTWLTNIKSKLFREYISKNTKILNIVNYSKKVFASATVDSVTFIVGKSIPGETDSINISIVDDGNNPVYQIHQIKQREWIEGDVFNIFVNDNEKKIIRKIENDSKMLDDICHVTVGLKPYQVGKGTPKQIRETVEKRIYDSDKKLDKDYRLYIRGSDINRYFLKNNKSQWIKYGKWLAEPRKEDFFNDKNKIVIRQTGDSLTATIDHDGFLCLNNLHTINLKDRNFDLRYILGLINSKVLNYYFQYLNPEKGEALAEVKATNVKRLPIKEASIDEQRIIINFVTKILNLNQELLKEAENSNEWSSIKTEIEKTDKKIDEEVYKLYSLTPDEIKIVESSA